MNIQNFRKGILVADLFCVFGALAVAIRLRYVGLSQGPGLSAHIQEYSVMVLTATVAWTFFYFEMDLDGFKGGWHLPAILSKLVVADALLMVVVFATAFLTQHYYSRLVLIYFAFFLIPGLVAIRVLARSLASIGVKNGGENRCVILGNGQVAQELAGKIASHPELSFQVIGFLFNDEPNTSNGSANSLGNGFTSVKTLQLLDLLAEHRIKKLVVALGQPNSAEVRKLIAECQKASIQVYLVPHSYDLYVSKAELLEIDGLPLLSLREHKLVGASSALKRVMDFVLSVGILLLISPLLLLAAMVVYIKKGKSFRAELRCGKDGLPFQMWRLNVDRHAPNPENYERFLVRWSLTELPQLWNVLRGDMSLVGPRPESAERLKHYSDWHRQRLKVRGGITGLAQVHGLREYHSSEDKARFDLQYILNWSLFLDLSLILQTVWTLLFRGLRREPPSEPFMSFRTGAREYVGREIANANRS
ncbi:MAG TPA: sugar transferase [Candidatus Acidoferrum sp.]